MDTKYCSLREAVGFHVQLKTVEWLGLVVATGEVSLSKAAQYLLLAIATKCCHLLVAAGCVSPESVSLMKAAHVVAQWWI